MPEVKTAVFTASGVLRTRTGFMSKAEIAALERFDSTTVAQVMIAWASTFECPSEQLWEIRQKLMSMSAADGHPMLTSVEVDAMMSLLRLHGGPEYGP